MASKLVGVLALCTSLLASVRCCPELCTCQDKFAHQFADCAYKDLLAVPSGLPSNVTTVSLSANKLTFLPSKVFANITQVTSLWLAHNEIVSVEMDTLAPLVQLRNLDVSYNKIVKFPWEDLRNLTALQLLKMNNNEMVDLPGDAFATLKDLRSLRINHNKFTTIVQGTFSALSSMSHLQIYNNPFSCSCSLEWLKDWMATTKISVPEPNSIVCNSPELHRGVMVSKIPKLDCKAPLVTITYQPDIDKTELLEGSTVVLNCETQGSPKPQVSWEVIAGNQNFLFPLPFGGETNNLPVNDKATNSRFLVFQNGTLVVPHLTKKEDGNYSCLAVNDLGKSQSSVKLTSRVSKKHAASSDDTVDRIRASPNKPSQPKTSKNNIIKSDDRTKIKPQGWPGKQDGGQVVPKDPVFSSKCGVRDGSEYVSNHAFNMSLDDLKQYTFDFGIIALEVSETDAKVKLNPLQLSRSKSNLHMSQGEKEDVLVQEPAGLYQASSGNHIPDMLYICVDTGYGHSLIKWSNIEDGVNSYLFTGLQPGTNYTLCLTYGGQDCQVQVVFTTRKKIPSLLIIVVVSIFLLGLATVPLLGATCCHLLYKYQGKTYKLVMKTQNPDQLEKQPDFHRRASLVESEKTFDPSEAGDGEGERDSPMQGDGGTEVTESIPGSSSKTNQDDFEAGSEYSDRLPLGAEAVNISEEINGNYKQSSR
ncbi:immunoglobulin superfamily containing leucine-rich repeat protein 2 [Nerophis ophidion]|uniref:immunoglobulin superfamily containing leucine-rich repeat protein 2 n=1 Tax=Nerophis ophidion TaxID=159077 RepID=UPI002AE01DBF|nr:immunoglobulin superfamily containing leucine-rich repeat protein 2 [Nerophis ophidion]